MNAVAETEQVGQTVLETHIVSAPSSSLEATAAEIKATMNAEWLAAQYRDRILPMRTRSFRLPVPPRGQVRIEIQHTLLGLELKIGKHRVSCPDLSTARYLAVWARLGCADVAIPYDISRISQLADELESAWHRMLLLIAHLAAERTESFRSRLRASLISKLREEVERAGAGPAVPQFKQSTRQRTPVI